MNISNLKLARKRAEIREVWVRLGTNREGWIPYNEIETILASLALESLPHWEKHSFTFDQIEKQYCSHSTIKLTIECGWLDFTDKQLRFTNEEIYAFFAGVSLSKMDFDRALRKLGYQTYWRRCYDKNDLVALSMVAVAKDPTEIVVKLANTDYLLAAKCITNGYYVPVKYREQVIQDLHNAMLQVTGGGEWRSAYCAEQLRLLGVSAAVIVPDIIETIKNMPITYVRTRLSKELAEFGKAAIPLLSEALKENDEGHWHEYIKQALEAIEQAA